MYIGTRTRTTIVQGIYLDVSHSKPNWQITIATLLSDSFSCFNEFRAALKKPFLITCIVTSAYVIDDQ